MSGIELFLMKQIFTPEEHPRGEDEFVYDNEHLHYGVLRVLCERQSDICSKVPHAVDYRAELTRISVGK
jgi:hypothetical protein